MDDTEIGRRLAGIENTLTDISKVLNGNGTAGLVTKVALCDQYIKSIPTPNSLRFYSTLGGGIMAVLGIIGYSFIKFLKST